MAELLERIKEIFTSKAALITVSVVAGLALIGGITTAVILDKRSQDPLKPEPAEPTEQMSEPEPEPEQEPEPVTADALLRDLEGRMEKANFVAGETEFVLLPVVPEEEEQPAAEEPATEEPTVEETAVIEEEPPAPDNSICYAFEADRTTGAIHTAGTVTKDGAGTGTESYVITKDGTIRVLSSRGGVWSSQEDEEIGPAIRGIDDITGLLRLSGCTLEQTTTEEGEERYVLKTRLNAGKTAVFLLAAGIGEEFSQETLDAFTGADAELVLKPDGLPEKMTVTAPATTEQAGFTWSMLFTGIDDGRSVTVPLEEIEQVIQTQKEQPQEQKKNNSSDDNEDADSTTTLDAGYHTNVWVDVDLTNQRITLYADGKAVMSSSCVTGSITRGYATPTGTYRVSYKTTNAYLLNNAYVNYWMPFNGGIGFHDASWRYGNFSADQAWSNGSHGCVNLPYSAAQTLYSYLHAGDVVVVHGWPQNPASSHIHTAGDWETVKEATCKEEGKRVRKCTGCGEIVESGVIPKTEHTEGEWVVTKEATEDKTGVKELHCSVCDAVLKTEKIPKAAHVHTANGKWEITKEPTCTKEGQRIQRCVKDNTIVLKEAVPATGHQWSITEEAATCTQDGTRTKTCTVCGAVETETIPATGHQWSITEEAATCTQDGSRTKTCTVCGVTETETIPASGHAPTTTRTNETAPTCTQDGSHENVTTCSICGLELSRETVSDPALGHSWGETDAEGYRHCSRCGEADYVGLPVPDDPDGQDGE